MGILKPSWGWVAVLLIVIIMLVAIDVHTQVSKRYTIRLNSFYYYCDDYTLTTNHLNLYGCGWTGYNESIRNPSNIRIR